ncbi:tetratricopeptide repeat protein [Brucepastera parasyntrophica]|uniref:tetratricopeptide repeat protein n=1 Tax=Brucepastera parasyntrophica TaxID=2880008 RepID=UPI002108EF79|nr:tetratricopeptide repeat protein [Brucepastera parasyntrophica]ULQ59037.1 tetratricopeptide repeat protein [Brucepastera parasyntrophica]
MKRLCISILIILFLLSGCVTKEIIDESNRTDMYVMVYDYENNGLQNVSVYIDDELIGKTDIHGRYLLALVRNQIYKIRLQKNEFEMVEKEFVYDPLFVLYFQIANSVQLLKLAENAMDEGGYEEAIGYLDRSIKLDPKRIDAFYLKAIALYKTGDSEGALEIIDTLASQVKNTEAIFDLAEQIYASAGGRL